MMQFQDWNEVTIGNGSRKKNIQIKESQAPSKPTVTEDEDPPKFRPFDPKLLVDLNTARNAKNIKRDQLAKQCMINVSEIADLENGKLDFNSKRAKSLYVKLMRTLGVANVNMASLNKL
jgi:ribosome-binding protein aMBF1 (putative translation factor)